MPESKPSDMAARPRDASTWWVAAGILAMAIGAGLFHPGAGLILGGLAMTAAGVLGGRRHG